MSEKLSATEICELVYTRISHDLIGNVGAVSNAVELLEEDDLDFLDDIKSILKTSSTVLSSRLKFFRLVFGLNNASMEQLDNIEKITSDYLKTVGSASAKTTVTLKISDVSFSKVAMLLTMIVSDLLTRGGHIEVVEHEDYIEAYAPDANISNDRADVVKNIIKGSYTNKTAQYAPVFFLKALLTELGCQIKISEDSEFELIVGKP